MAAYSNLFPPYSLNRHLRVSKNTETDNNLKSTSSKRTQPEHLILGWFPIGICSYSIQSMERKFCKGFFLINFLPMRALKLKPGLYVHTDSN